MSGGSAIDSPCIGVCVCDRVAHYCQGCYRSPDEIAAWSLMSPRERRSVMRRLEARRGAGGVAREEIDETTTGDAR